MSAKILSYQLICDLSYTNEEYNDEFKKIANYLNRKIVRTDFKSKFELNKNMNLLRVYHSNYNKMS